MMTVKQLLYSTLFKKTPTKTKKQKIQIKGYKYKESVVFRVLESYLINNILIWIATADQQNWTSTECNPNQEKYKLKLKL